MNNKPSLTNKNFVRAHKVLHDVVDFFDQTNIDYQLEGGTLLGIVRDNSLLPWDHDIDLSISIQDSEKLSRNTYKLLLKGYRIKKRKMEVSHGPLKEGNLRIIKVKRFIPSILKFIFPSFNKHMVVADIFVKASDNDHTYWQAQKKILRVCKSHYSSFDTVEFQNKELKVPNNYKEYLTQKYGNWKVPVKCWKCSDHELTIIGNAV